MVRLVRPEDRKMRSHPFRPTRLAWTRTDHIRQLASRCRFKYSKIGEIAPLSRHEDTDGRQKSILAEEHFWCYSDSKRMRRDDDRSMNTTPEEKQEPPTR